MTSVSPDAGVVVELLARAGIRLAILETATHGTVAALLAEHNAAAQVLTVRYVLDNSAALSAQLHVSRAKIDAFGWVSEMVAAEAAAALIDTYEGGWGLALLGNLQPQPDVNGEADEAIVALGAPSATVVRRCSAADAIRVAFELLYAQATTQIASP